MGSWAFWAGPIRQDNGFRREGNEKVSWLLFLDESGHDHRNTPYEVRGGVALHASEIWPFVQDMQRLELAAFGTALHQFRTELKGSRLLEKKRFRWAAQKSRSRPISAHGFRSCNFTAKVAETGRLMTPMASYLCPIPIRPAEKKKKEAMPSGPPESSPWAEPPTLRLAYRPSAVKRNSTCIPSEIPSSRPRD